MTTPHFGMLFHFTHLENLPDVLRAGALLSDSLVTKGGLLSNEAGDREIKDRRRRRRVTCSPGGVVADYVPFYFAARSPMMLKLKSGGVPTFRGDHRDLVYLVSDVATMLGQHAQFAISDRNAATALADFANDPQVLGDLSSPQPSSDFVDWTIMNLTYWNDTAVYPDRMERRMAEFLVHERVPLGYIQAVAVHNDTVRDSVEHMFAATDCTLPVILKPSWYYA